MSGNIRSNMQAAIQNAINATKADILQREMDRRIRKAHRRYRVKVALIIAWWAFCVAFGVGVLLSHTNPWLEASIALWVAWGVLWLVLARDALKKTYRDLAQPFETRKGKGNGRYRRAGQVDRTGAGGGTHPGPRTGGSASMSNEADFAGLEFSPGEVFGSRSFKVDVLGRLTGVAYETVWRPGENTAECKMVYTLYEVKNYWPRIYEKLTGETVKQPPGVGIGMPAGYSLGGIYVNGGIYGYDAPVTERDRQRVCDVEHNMTQCGHGFYGYYEGSNDYGDQGLVNGVIRGWGKTTLIGTRGFRVPKAEIVALHIKSSVDPQLAARIRKNYPDIPFFDDYKTMIAEFPPDPGAEGLKGPESPEFWDLKL